MCIRRLCTGSLAGLTLLGCESLPPTSISADDDAALSITVPDLRATVEAIAHDSTGGRASASPEFEKAARYVAARFRAAGLKAGGTDGYLQPFPFSFGGQSFNTVGMLRGSDPKRRGEFVVFSAHLDHLGISHGTGGDTIFNGADDNASGAATLIELAEAFATLDPAPPRTIVFIAFAGEENGLLGSSYFTSHPTFPLESTIGLLNIDMVGRSASNGVQDPGNSVAAIGKERSFLGSLSDRVAAEHPELEIALLDDPWPQERLFGRSDQLHFFRKGIPVLLFTTGLHQDYHRTSDEAELIDYVKTMRIARLLFHIGVELATVADVPAD
jgi:Zn-dependent M28 family amino/carboxypeptidase